MKKAKFQWQYIGTRNITQGSKVRETIDQIQAAELWKIRNTRFNLLAVISKGKVTPWFKCTGLFFNSNCLVYKLSSPNLTWKNHFCSESTKACISRQIDSVSLRF